MTAPSAADPLGRVSVVLMEPQSPGNIGAAARALANMGFRRLVVVGAPEFRVPEARRMAMGGLEVLLAAAEASTLTEAVAGAGLVVGTTRRVGKNRRPFLDVREAAGKVLAAAASGNDVAVVFGREDSGLTTAELGTCQILATIPTDSSCSSLNLAQSVLLLAYELRRSRDDGRATTEEPPRNLATARETEAMYEDLASILEEIGFLNPQNPEEILHALRRFLGRAEPESREVRIVRGMVRQMRWTARRRQDEE